MSNLSPTQNIPRKKWIRVVQDEENPVEKKVLAQSIRDISKAFQKLLSSGLNQRAIVSLVHDSSGVGKPDIRAVLESLKTLEKEFCQ